MHACATKNVTNFSLQYNRDMFELRAISFFPFPFPFSFPFSFSFSFSFSLSLSISLFSLSFSEEEVPKYAESIVIIECTLQINPTLSPHVCVCVCVCVYMYICTLYMHSISAYYSSAW